MSRMQRWLVRGLAVMAVALSSMTLHAVSCAAAAEEPEVQVWGSPGDCAEGCSTRCGSLCYCCSCCGAGCS